MGMYCNFWRLASPKTEKLKEIFMENGPEAATELLDLLDDETGFSLDKAWDGLNYLLCNGEIYGDYPNGFIKGSGAQPIVEDERIEEFPMLFFTPEQTAEISKYLVGLGRDALHEQYKPEAMNDDVYPSVYAEEGEEAFDWLYEMFLKLRDFFKAAADGGEATCTMIS